MSRALTDSEFITEIQDCYNGKYSDNQKDRILKLIEPLNSEQIGLLFQHIEINYLKNMKPSFGHIYGYMRALGYIKKTVPTNSSQMHKQSPYQMVLRYKDKPAEWIIQQCKNIQNLPDEEMTSARYSFNYHWNYLMSVQKQHREEMREYIIQQDMEKIYDLLDRKGIKIETQRKHDKES